MRYFGLALVGLVLATSAAAARDWHVVEGGSGDGSDASPFGRIQDGMDAAGAGDVVVVGVGTYAEQVRSQSDGVTLRAAPGAQVLVTAPGRPLRIDHASVTVEGITFDAQYADQEVVDVNAEADFLTLRDLEIRRSSKNCVNMGDPEGVRIIGCLIHHCLKTTDTGQRDDAHGITASAARDLLIQDTDIHTFSGDAVQLDDGRTEPGWDRLTIQGCHFWLEPLPQAVNGYAAGDVPGENAVDTKTWADGPRASIRIVDTVAHGFRGGFIDNMAAFNLKEKVDAFVDGVTVFDSEIAFRLRGPGARPGAWVHIQNAVVYDVDAAVRYEDDIESIGIVNSTIGLDVDWPFREEQADNSGVDVRNFLVLADALPAEAQAASNLAVGAGVFVDAAGGDYHLLAGSAAIDAGETIAEVVTDRDGVPRPQGADFDVGAYEFVSGSVDAGLDAGEEDAGEDAGMDAGSDPGADAGSVPDDTGPLEDSDSNSGVSGQCGCGGGAGASGCIWILLGAAFMYGLRRGSRLSFHRT